MSKAVTFSEYGVRDDREDSREVPVAHVYRSRTPVARTR